MGTEIKEQMSTEGLLGKVFFLLHETHRAMPSADFSDD